MVGIVVSNLGYYETGMYKKININEKRYFNFSEVQKLSTKQKDIWKKIKIESSVKQALKLERKAIIKSQRTALKNENDSYWRSRSEELESKLIQGDTSGYFQIISWFKN